MSNELENTGKILIYQNEKGDTKIDVYFEGDTIWMTQKSMCDLYQVAKSSIRDGKRISYEDFGRIKIPYPALDEQIAIAKVLSTADRENDLLRQDIEQEKQKKKALMQLLLTGIVRVTR